VNGSSPQGWLAFLARFWQFLLGSTLVAGGLVAIVVGYLGASGTVHVGLQVPYLLSGGLLGLALVVFGSALLIAHALGRQSRLLRRLVDEVQELEALGVAPVAPRAPAPSDGLVLVPAGASSFHRPGCRLLEGKTARRLKPETAARRGLSPCSLCDPLGSGDILPSR